MKKGTASGRWFKLDNAAKVFPGQNSRTWSNIFRLSVVLNEAVEPDILEQALKDVMPRFPCFKVRMRNGFFWHYMSENPSPAPKLMEDIKNPCHRVNFKENDGYMLRVYYHNNRISVDTFHSLCDGHGNAMFSFTLLARYYALKGETIPFTGMVLDPSVPASERELEDSFLSNATSKAKYDRKEKFVYHPDGTKLPPHMVNITSGIIPFSSLHAITKAKGVTVTEYIAAVLMKVHMDKQRREERFQKEVAIQVPIDLRRVFGSETLRNFTICLRTKVDPNKGDYTFDELLRLVSLQLRLANNRHDLNAMITANTALERNRLLRAAPLFIKELGMKISFIITGEQTTTSLLSNIGAINVPEELARHIERVNFMPGPGIKNPARVGISTINDKLVITFASIHEESDIERDFFTFLVKEGLHVCIESNR